MDSQTLSLDIGGTSIKTALLTDKGSLTRDVLRVTTPRPATPSRVIDAIAEVAPTLGDFGRVSVGFPGVVVRGVTMTAPNLHDEWRGFALARALGRRLKKPVRVLNDAGMHGYGVIGARGTELVLTLGTGMGCALYVDGKYVPNLELAHHPFDAKHTYEGYIGLAAFKRAGKKKWNQRVALVIDRVMTLFNPDALYLGGGNATQLAIKLPAKARVIDNAAGVLGGAALWRD